MSDICERLVRFAGKVCLSTDTEVEAATEIERLSEEVVTLRAALKRMLLEFDFMIESGIISDCRNDVIFENARTALNGTDND